MKSVGVLLMVAALAGAPFQCSGDPDPERAMEDSPEESLYLLARRFRKAGDHAAWKRTLEYLIERYPSSRFATMAAQDLGKLDEPEPEPAPSTAPSTAESARGGAAARGASAGD
jgi:hypothetical protein